MALLASAARWLCVTDLDGSAPPVRGEAPPPQRARCGPSPRGQAGPCDRRLRSASGPLECYRGSGGGGFGSSCAPRPPVTGRVVRSVVRCVSCRDGTPRQALSETGTSPAVRRTGGPGSSRRFRFRPNCWQATATTVESIPARHDPKIIAATSHRPCAGGSGQFARAGAVNRTHPARLSASGVTSRTSVGVPAACPERLVWPPLRRRR
jgi:hypothetical protein